jgi:hypothetical protein
MTQPCEALPMLVVAPGDDMRKPLLLNRAESEKVLAECEAKRAAIVNAVNPLNRAARAERSTK